MTGPDTIQAVGVVVNVVIAIIYLFTLRAIKRQGNIAEATAQQALNASFLQLFPLVERHHSKEVAEFRRFARNVLPQKCAEARKEGKKLKEYDSAASKVVSDIANYYESLGMLIQHGEKKLLPDIQEMLLDMVQQSAHDIWEIFYDNLDIIHDDSEHIGLWAGSFERMYRKVGEFNPDLPATRPELKRKMPNKAL